MKASGWLVADRHVVRERYTGLNDWEDLVERGSVALLPDGTFFEFGWYRYERPNGGGESGNYAEIIEVAGQLKREYDDRPREEWLSYEFWVSKVLQLVPKGRN